MKPRAGGRQCTDWERPIGTFMGGGNFPYLDPHVAYIKRHMEINVHLVGYLRLVNFKSVVFLFGWVAGLVFV